MAKPMRPDFAINLVADTKSSWFDMFSLLFILSKPVAAAAGFRLDYPPILKKVGLPIPPDKEIL